MLQRSRSLRSECHLVELAFDIGAKGFNEVAPFGASATGIVGPDGRDNYASTKSLPSERVPRAFQEYLKLTKKLQRSRSLRSECHGRFRSI